MDAPLIRSGRAALQQVIESLTDGVVLLEPDGTIVWANAAALAMHGVHELDELGQTAAGYRDRFRLTFLNNHALAADRYAFDRLLAGDTFEDVIVEVTPLDSSEVRWVHRQRGLAVYDTDGKVEFYVLILKDETERLEAEERFEKAFNANPAPALICRISDEVYVRVNQGFLDMTGHERSAIASRTVRDFDVFTGADRHDYAFQRLAEGPSITQMEAEVPLPDGGARAVIVAGQPIDVAGEPCMLFTFADLEPRRKAETSLRKSEERFSKSFRLSPVPGAITRVSDHVFTEVNRAFEAMVGQSSVEIIGRSAADLHLWASPEQRRSVETRLKAGEGLQGEAMQLRASDGVTLNCLVSVEPVEIADEACALWVIQDVTDRKRTEDELMAAIESVMADTSWFSRSVVERLANLRQAARPHAPQTEVADLTRREREILTLISEGCDNLEMADRLSLSPNTVRNHVASLFRKIGVGRRAAAVVWARERGITGKGAPPARPPRNRS